MGWEINRFLKSHGMEYTEGIMSRHEMDDPCELELSAKKVLKYLNGRSAVNPATEYMLHCVSIWPSYPVGILWDDSDD